MVVIFLAVFYSMCFFFKIKLAYMYLDQPPNIDCQDLVREKGYDNLVQSAYLQDQVIQKLDNEDDNILALANPF